ncbi:hypothetical protein, partial [Treponema endosymbiont of Eucomonympha sp.]|uniref:hypothetical protein n=1 Tax=Treponema endosymbiont of Eucomonympha sp. TaxID=1580831 RepID=UPI001E3AB3E2
MNRPIQLLPQLRRLGLPNGEEGSGLCPFPSSSHRGSGFAASPMTAYRRGIAEKSLYYIEI